MARRRRHRHLRGLIDLDMGSDKKNVLLGAGLNIGGNLIAKKVPTVGGFLAQIPVLGDSPGMALAAIAAAYNFFLKKKKATAINIIIGAALVSANELLVKYLPSLSLITTDLSAVVPTVRMSDGTMRALTDGELGGPDVSVTQGLGMSRADVLQGGILQ